MRSTLTRGLTVGAGLGLVILTGACAAQSSPTASAGTGTSPAPVTTTAAAPTSPTAAPAKTSTKSTKPGIPDDGTQFVIMHSYDKVPGMAQMEPAVLKGGKFVGTGDVIPVGIDPSAKWFSVQGGNPECLKGKDVKTKNPGPGDVIGSCLDGYDKSMDGEVMQIATHNHGAAYEVSEVYLP